MNSSLCQKLFHLKKSERERKDYGGPDCQVHPYNRALPSPMRQAIVDAHAAYPGLSLHEIARICYVQFNRKPSHHTIQRDHPGRNGEIRGQMS